MSKLSGLVIRDKLKILIVDQFGAGVFSRQALLSAWIPKYPNNHTSSVLPADYCVNEKTGRHTKPEHRFLFAVEEGKYRIYDPFRDGKWKIDENGARQVL